MVNDVASAIVPTVVVKRSLVTSLVLGEGDTEKLLATSARNSQDATAYFLTKN